MSLIISPSSKITERQFVVDALWKSPLLVSIGCLCLHSQTHKVMHNFSFLNHFLSLILVSCGIWWSPLLLPSVLFVSLFSSSVSLFVLFTIYLAHRQFIILTLPITDSTMWNYYWNIIWIWLGVSFKCFSNMKYFITCTFNHCRHITINWSTQKIQSEAIIVRHLVTVIK